MKTTESSSLGEHYCLGDGARHERRRLIRFFIGIAFALILAFAAESLVGGNRLHGMVLLCIDGLLALDYLYLRRSGNAAAATQVFNLVMVLLYLHLFVTGGFRNTGLLWFYVYPPLAFFVMGVRGALISMGLVCAASTAWVVFLGVPPFLAEYSSDFLLRFAGSLMAIILLSYFYERSREARRDELILLAGKLDELATVDDLTRLLNRRSMRTLLETEKARHTRSSSQFAVVMADIDHFKKINDGFGHSAGDRVLVEVARIIARGLRTGDAAARWGGEEFLILLPGTDDKGAINLAERLRREVEGLEMHGLGRVTMSFGVLAVDGEGGMDEALQNVDRRLYEAKALGRNRVVGAC